ncbi:FAD-dependent oxidoreductase [Spirillospora albida]|uniref:FAD-dependent oxidoreductase n=1 Tax=Spirillospora albida TaxID=58123 RepID=UPI001FE14078|nr:FAD-dependent monooxygenase [Spirillospora albida]
MAAAAHAPDPDAIGLDVLRDLYRREEVPNALLHAVTALHRPTLMHSLAKVPTWHNDRIVLVGDTLHPVGAGQGASMAIEDAIVLARALETTADVPTALAAYRRTRQARVTRTLKAGDDSRDAKTMGPIARRVRNLIMPLAFRFAYERATSWLYTDDATSARHEPADSSRPR